MSLMVGNAQLLNVDLIGGQGKDLLATVAPQSLGEGNQP
jgi:hypothetical protein